MASPAVAGTPATTAISSATTSATINLPSGIVAGETLMLFLGDVAAGTSSAAGWTAEAGANTRMLYRKADGAEGSTVTVACPSSKIAAIVYRISGAADPTVTAPFVSSTTNGTSANPNCPACTPTGGSDDY